MLLIFGMGIFPQFFLKYSSFSLNYLYEQKGNYELNIKTSLIQKDIRLKSNTLNTLLVKKGKEKSYE